MHFELLSRGVCAFLQVCNSYHVHTSMCVYPCAWLRNMLEIPSSIYTFFIFLLRENVEKFGELAVLRVL